MAPRRIQSTRLGTYRWTVRTCACCRRSLAATTSPTTFHRASSPAHPLYVDGAPESASERARVSWMKEPYAEGLASHRGPGSYADRREAVGGALIGVRTGWDNEPRNQSSGEAPTSSGQAEGNIQCVGMRDGLGHPGSETPRMCGNTLLESGRPPASPRSTAIWLSSAS